MMKRYYPKLVIAILLVLLGISVYLYNSKAKYTTVNKDARNFSYKDTAAITKMFIADKEGNQSVIVRTPKGWVVNGKYTCRGEAILNLLEVVKNVEVRMSVPKEAQRNVISLMSSKALKVEVYADDELVKQFYVGHEAEDFEGSYMLLTDIESGLNFNEPYICFIPGFIGYLHPRFIAGENEWRDRVVINYIPPQIKEIRVSNYEQPSDSSFSIELANANTFTLKNAGGRELPFDEARLKQYLMYFQNISYEGLITNKNKKLQDSLTLQKPFYEITVTTTKYSTDVYKFYRKQFLGDVNPELGVQYDYDPDRFYLCFANNKEWAICQYFVLGKLLVSAAYFSAGITVKK